MNINDVFFEKTAISHREFKSILDKYELKVKDYSSKVHSDGKLTYSLTFVGFIINTNGNILVSFPLNYNIDTNDNSEIISASNKIIRTINKYDTSSKDLYISNQGDTIKDTNFPFDAFFGIYDYFSKYGLHFHFDQRITTTPSNKINWKTTLDRTNYYLNNDKVIFFPIYYDHKYKTDTFITICMIHSINTTLQQYGFIIGLNDTGSPTPDFNFEKEYIVQKLYEVKSIIFNDIERQLIDHLISFYSQANNQTKNSIYFKHYAYYDVWEKMVYNYLEYNFDTIDKNYNVIYKHMPVPYFVPKKERFYPNESKSDQFIEIDYYLAEDKTQYIFDAKYKLIESIDYKQLAYYFLLKDFVPKYIWDTLKEEEKETHSAYFIENYSVMFTPYNCWQDSIIHFHPKLQFSRDNQKMYVLEARMLINDVVDFWIT